MTVPADASERPDPQSPSRADRPAGPEHHVRPTLTATDAVAGVCPYLASAGGAWRTVTPSRDHRCRAVQPPAAQSTDKQRRHCLASDHVACQMFRAARAARAASLIAGGEPAMVERADRARRPLARTAPILLEPPRLVDRAVRLRLDRGPGQVALIGLMLLAFAVVALARLAGGAVATASVAPSVLVVASVRPPTPTAVRASPSEAPSVAPSESVAPSARATYTVKRGDTLLAIARRFNTTAAKIRAANGMTTSNLKIGQVLRIP